MRRRGKNNSKGSKNPCLLVLLLRQFAKRLAQENGVTTPRAKGQLALINALALRALVQGRGGACQARHFRR